MHYQLVMTLKPNPQDEGQARKALASFAARTEALPGCMSAGIFADLRRPDHVVFVEEWASEEALKAHLRSESYRKLLDVAHTTGKTPQIHIHQISQTTDALAFGA